MRRAVSAAIVVAAATLAVAACGSDPVTDASQDVVFTPCTETECAGSLPGGAAFEILMPETWNGSLAIYSGGSRAATTVPKSTSRKPSGAASKSASTAKPPSGSAAPAPLWSSGDKSIADVMLEAGYAIAGATPKDQGWSVAARIRSGEELFEYFKSHVAKPNRVYLWGESEGGLASVRLAELHPDWVSGAAALCAPLAGPRPTFNQALDGAFAVKQLLYPRMKLTGYSSEAEAAAVRDAAMAQVRRAAADPSGQAKVLFIGAVSGLPSRTRTQAGYETDSRVAAYVEGIGYLLERSTTGRYDLESKVGGNPSGNFGTDYRARIGQDESVAIDALVPGGTVALYGKLKTGQRIKPDPRAELSAAAHGELVGNLEVPVLTLHNAADPVYVSQSETWYVERTAARGSAERANLIDLFVTPPSGHSPESPAEEGAGGCVFKPRTILGTMIALNAWVRNGVYPGTQSIEKAFAGAPVVIDGTVGPWPEMALSPRDPALEPRPDQIYQPRPTPTATTRRSSSTSAKAAAGTRPAKSGGAKKQ